MNDYTNFHDYSHGDLRKMVQAMDSGGVMAASDPWRNAVKTLKDIRAALNTASADATSSWEGSTSDAFHSKMTTLANHVNTAAAYANDAAVSMQMMSEAIDAAKRDMPEEPGFWDEVGDGAKGFAESAVGMDNATTETSLADRKKDQAVAVMETLATKYRATTAYLKPPQGMVEENKQEISSDNNSPAEAISALIMGGGMGIAGGNQASGGSATATRSSGPSLGRTPQSQSPKEVAARPTDPGIKGGTANPVSTPKSPTSFGPGTGLDGIQAGVPTTSVGGGSLSLGGGGDVLAAEHGGIGGMPSGLGGGFGAGAAGRVNSAFGAGGMEGGKGTGAGGKGSAASRSGKSSFTEGGSGLGRGRGQGAAGHGMPGGSQAGKKDKKQAKERPDYLVEDEETWMSGEKANPNVVE